MRIAYIPEDYVSEIRRNVCAFHEKYPDLNTAGCTCSSSFFLRRATPEERAANVKAANERAQREAQARRDFPGWYP